MSEATTAQPAAMPSSSTMPKDSPCSDGRAQHVRSRQSRRHLLVGEPAQPLHPVRRQLPPALHLGARPVAGHPQDGGPLQPGEGVEQDGQALARLVATEEQDHGTARGVPDRSRRLEPVHLDAVEQDLELAAALALPRVAGGFGDRHPDLQAAADQLGQRHAAGGPIGSRRPGGRCRPSGAGR